MTAYRRASEKLMFVLISYFMSTHYHVIGGLPWMLTLNVFSSYKTYNNLTGVLTKTTTFDHVIHLLSSLHEPSCHARCDFGELLTVRWASFFGDFIASWCIQPHVFQWWLIIFPSGKNWRHQSFYYCNPFLWNIFMVVSR